MRLLCLLVVGPVLMLTLLLPLSGCGRLGFGAVDDEPDAAAITPDAPRDVCDSEPAGDTVALYTFDASLTADATGNHAATNLGATSTTAARCGTGAAAFDGVGYLRIADSPAFDLAEGAVELFARATVPGTGALQGILARDASGTDFDGHFLIAFSNAGHLFARIQHTPDTHVFRCTAAPVSPDWHHVVVRFGPPAFRMWVDEREVTGTSFDYDGDIVDCTAPHAFGIAGNDNTMVIGGLNYVAANSEPEPAIAAKLTGEVDQVHLRRTYGP